MYMLVVVLAARKNVTVQPTIVRIVVVIAATYRLLVANCRFADCDQVTEQFCGQATLFSHKMFYVFCCLTGQLVVAFIFIAFANSLLQLLLDLRLLFTNHPAFSCYVHERRLFCCTANKNFRRGNCFLRLLSALF